jgi:uncharacterized membrane protein
MDTRDEIGRNADDPITTDDTIETTDTLHANETHATTGGAAAAGAVTGGVIGLIGGPAGAAVGAVGGAIVGAAAERIMHHDDDAHTQPTVIDTTDQIPSTTDSDTGLTTE